MVEGGGRERRETVAETTKTRELEWSLQSRELALTRKEAGNGSTCL